LMDEIDEAENLGSITALKDKIKCMRRSGLGKGGEYSVENLSFKMLRNAGYLEKLNNMKTTKMDRELSILEKKYLGEDKDPNSIDDLEQDSLRHGGEELRNVEPEEEREKIYQQHVQDAQKRREELPATERPSAEPTPETLSTQTSDSQLQALKVELYKLAALMTFGSADSEKIGNRFYSTIEYA